MRHTLKLHPDSRCRAVTRIDVDLARSSAAGLSLHYAVTGKIGDLRLPAVTSPARVDELWKHTCFELFVRGPRGGYYEFNFSPSTQWAAYRFGDYREGMTVASEIDTPRIEVRSTSERCELTVALDLSRASLLPGGATWRLGLATVIEEISGERSYWALLHPPGRPDFHHPDEFACDLSPPEQR